MSLSQPVAENTLGDALSDCAMAVDAVMDQLMPSGTGPESQIYDAIRYSALGGGKRLRPFLVVQGASLFDVPTDRAYRVASAIEFVHCYSLVHDDLPAMDDDDLRRGKPTTHIKYDEATAILAGDALQALAFEVLAERATHPDGDVRAELVRTLASAAGAEGMVGGQMFDLKAEVEGTDFDLEKIMRLQQMKTGCLFRFSCEAGAILGGGSEKEREALCNYSRDLGLAFQIADDILDATGSESEVGKKVGKDAEAGKATFISLLGLETAKERAKLLADQAAQHVSIFGSASDLLKQAAFFVVERRS
jgi:farnesyl diphosphate synthase